MGVYRIKCLINGKVYIGKSNDVKRRWREHKSRLKRNNHENEKLQHDWNKYGEDNFEFKLIENYDNEEFGIELEKKYINEYKSCDLNFGYNMTLGKGESGGEIPTEETKKKLKGHEVSEETKKKISESNIGNKNALGYKHTEESKKKISESHKGKRLSEEHKKHLSESRKGKTLTEEHKKKISMGNKGKNTGKIRTEEHKKKIGESRKGKCCGEDNCNYGKTGLKNHCSIALICIFPDGTQTEPMNQQELAKYLNINVKTIRKLQRSGEPYNPKKKSLLHLKGIQILDYKIN